MANMNDSVDTEKFSDVLTETLLKLGYGSCFFVPGGNIMHLLNSARTRMKCVPFVHEVSAAIAAEYYNEVWSTHDLEHEGRAYTLVTAGPGITNAVTGIAGAFLESRDLLVLGGQVKSSDLSNGQVRQRGIQEIDGSAIVRPICKVSERIENPVSSQVIRSWVAEGLTDRRGPVFLEVCLDAQGSQVQRSAVDFEPLGTNIVSPERRDTVAQAVEAIHEELRRAKRPVLLIGGGVAPSVAWRNADGLDRLGIPVMTTWNGFDRVSDDHPCFVGRPNTWGQRSANILLAQSDLIVVLGSRLGIQQTGFNWQSWSSGRVIQIEIDPAELVKGHPQVEAGIAADANEVLAQLVEMNLNDIQVDHDWTDFCSRVRKMVPLIDDANMNDDGFVSPYELVSELSDLMVAGEILIPASSGSGQFVPMEVFRSKPGQRVITNKGLASMGYGLPAAIGAALAAPDVRTFLIEGDGSFSQSIQELGTVAVNNLNLKILILDNDGYASIRTTQKNYFGGVYLGCDAATGLGFPAWCELATAFGIPALVLDTYGLKSDDARTLLEAPGPAIFVVPVDPDQTYFPKVTSRIQDDGSMQSNPIHYMFPELPHEVASEVFKFVEAPQ